MRITVSDRLVNHRVNERSSFDLTARFYSDATDTWSTTTPTSVRYRIDNPDTGLSLVDWTTVSTGTSVTITASTTANTIQDDCKPEERRQLTVQVDNGLSTQYCATRDWWVKNLTGQT